MFFCFCPNCGEQVHSHNRGLNVSKFVCSSCHYVLYANVAATASMILVCGSEVLFSIRGGEPSKGLLDFPGGFVSPGESNEEAFVREMEEELDWAPEQFEYAFSFPNKYKYKEVEYNTSDIFYFAQVAEKPDLVPQDDVSDIRWIELSEVQDEQLAFESMRMAVGQLKQVFGVDE